MSESLKVIEASNTILSKKIGNRVVATRVLMKNGNRFVVELSVDMPRFIDDDKNKKMNIKIIKFHGVSKLVVQMKARNKFVIEELPNRDVLSSIVKNKLDSYIFNLERLLLENTYNQFTKISLIETSMNPFHRILINFRDRNEVDQQDILKSYPKKRRARLKFYFDLLEELELIRKIDGGMYTQGNNYIILNELSVKKKQDLINSLLSYIIKERYAYLIEVMKLMQITPFLRIATSYYSMSIEHGKILNVTPETLLKNYNEVYDLNNKNVNKFNNQLQMLLSHTDILERNGNFIIGNAEYFRNMKNNISTALPKGIEVSAFN